MTSAPAISSRPPSAPGQDFEGLRKSALEQITTLAGSTWTDHNAHDPGITILDACCYAMTEVAMRLELDVVDLIASGARKAEPRLPPAHRVLPSAPVTEADLRRVLLDHHRVGDAWLTTGVPDRVQYFAAGPGADPPLTYTPGAVLVTPGGLFEVLLAFEDPQLNNNTYSFPVVIGVDTYNLDFALPHWDEEASLPFRAGATVTNIAMLNPGAEWRALDEQHAFFGEARIDFAGPGGPGSVDAWVLMRVTDPPDQPAAVLPGILAAAKVVAESLAPAGLVASYVARISAAQADVARVERYLQSWRNLCEDPVRLSVSRVQEIAIHARIEVASSTGLEDLVAEIFFALDAKLSPPVRFENLAARRASGRSTEEIFDGPLLTHGFAAPLDKDSLIRADQIFLSDVLRLIVGPRTTGVVSLSNQENPSGREIVAVTGLTLSNYVNNRIITNKASACLRLVEIARYRPRLSLSKSRILLFRDDVELAYDMARVAARFEELVAATQTTARLTDFDPVWPVPSGDDLPIDDYYPLQNDLPALYGVTEAGLPDDATGPRRQQALQLRAYLLLFEQFLADCAEQLVNINRFFSPSAAETTSYFTRPLLEVEDMNKLVRRFTGGSWVAFTSDADNAFSAAIRAAAEEEHVALDRRNRVLDHLLARHGEDAFALGQELHRFGQKSVLQSTLPPSSLPARLRERRARVNHRLLHAKAAFLADLPELQALRLAGFADPLQWLPGLVVVQGAAGGTGFDWRVVRDGAIAFESVAPAETRGEAIARAREVIVLAASPAHYDAVNFGGPVNRRYVLRAGANATDPILARGGIGFANLPAATAAGIDARRDFERLRMRESRTAMERRIDYLIGIDYRGRRQLDVPLGDYFEIVNAPGPAFTKRWRLRSETGGAGDVLLVSAGTFNDAVEAEADRLASESIEQALRVATDEWSYRITQTGPAAHVLEVVDPDNVALARAPGSFPTEAAARTAARRSATHLYAHYSFEGLQVVENLLLRPHAVGEPFMSLPAGNGERLVDPYSQRLTIVLPSGYARDFGVPNAARAPARPHRFRDAEFRRHAERIIRESCPAHILPEIWWVDRESPATPASEASFNGFEARYFDWLAALLVPGTAPATIAGARAALAASVEAIVEG